VKLLSFDPQSPKWDRVRVELPTDARQVSLNGQPMWSGRARVEVVEDGLTKWVSVVPDPEAETVSVMAIVFSGRVFVSSATPDLGEVYVANKGNWSGGGNYLGVAIGREGCRVVCKCGGTADYFQVIDGQWKPSKPLPKVS